MIDLNSFLGFNIITSLAKVFFLALSFMFVIFSIIIFKQVLSMDNLVHEADYAFLIKFIAFIFIVLSVSLFFAALVIL